ncbi:hypothetical protein PSDVSF_15630 [Pseudodesulfovibrio sediminis]|uniref:RNA-directed DNA polymerase n=1 Tax=Pseudodesulfovibrio sediminis TaxID=2810563 RepID=A0ABN6EPD9_9BACT|nr:hypothetical protein PSDVSF_15630 [Pseudodesulfovibrio sediminis]
MTPHDEVCPLIGLKSPNSLARILGYSLDHLNEVCESIPSFYRKKEITKKDGSARVLSVPSAPLRRIQSAILRHLSKFELHPAAYGAVKKRCHVDNAKQHAAAPFVYCLDFSSFFPSISSRRIYELFIQQLQCSPPVAGVLSKLTTYKYKLPTGSPTSPVLANILCQPLDVRLGNLSDAHNVVYTRFIDDLTFSGRVIPEEFMLKAKEIVESFGLKLNEGKEELFTPMNGKLVTGVNVNNKKIRVSRDYKRSVRAQKHQLELFEEYMTPSEIKKEESRVVGKDQYIKMVKTR